MSVGVASHHVNFALPVGSGSSFCSVVGSGASSALQLCNTTVDSRQIHAATVLDGIMDFEFATGKQHQIVPKEEISGGAALVNHLHNSSSLNRVHAGGSAHSAVHPFHDGHSSSPPASMTLYHHQAVSSCGQTFNSASPEVDIDDDDDMDFQDMHAGEDGSAGGDDSIDAGMVDELGGRRHSGAGLPHQQHVAAVATSEGGNGQQSPSHRSHAGQCKVCGDEATGMYFGALVCVPCKTFFLRYAGDGFSFVCKFSKQCEITVATRTQCKFCRYQKCIRAGMYRRVRPAQVQLSAGQQLCVVCHDVANGIHFGAITCEGCKKFFRRGLTENSSYVCKSGQNCVINPRTRNSCRYCRYQMCLRVGMSREAIQMGRPSKISSVDAISQAMSPRPLSIPGKVEMPFCGGGGQSIIQLSPQSLSSIGKHASLSAVGGLQSGTSSDSGWRSLQNYEIMTDGDQLIGLLQPSSRWSPHCIDGSTGLTPRRQHHSNSWSSSGGDSSIHGSDFAVANGNNGELMMAGDDLPSTEPSPKRRMSDSLMSSSSSVSYQFSPSGGLAGSVGSGRDSVGDRSRMSSASSSGQEALLAAAAAAVNHVGYRSSPITMGNTGSVIAGLWPSPPTANSPAYSGHHYIEDHKQDGLTTTAVECSSVPLVARLQPAGTVVNNQVYLWQVLPTGVATVQQQQQQQQQQAVGNATVLQQSNADVNVIQQHQLQLQQQHRQRIALASPQLLQDQMVHIIKPEDIGGSSGSPTGSLDAASGSFQSREMRNVLDHIIRESGVRSIHDGVDAHQLQLQQLGSHDTLTSDLVQLIYSGGNGNDGSAGQGHSEQGQFVQQLHDSAALLQQQQPLSVYENVTAVQATTSQTLADFDASNLHVVNDASNSPHWFDQLTEQLVRDRPAGGLGDMGLNQTMGVMESASMVGQLAGMHHQQDATVKPPEDSSTGDPDLDEQIQVSVAYWQHMDLPDENVMLAERHWEILNRVVPAYNKFTQLGTNVNRMLKAKFDTWVQQHPDETTRMAKLSEWIQANVVTIYTYLSVCYFQSLPGFTRFTKSDQKTLMRLGQSTSRILVAALHWYDSEEKTFRNFLCWRPMKAGQIDRFKQKLIEYADRINALELDAIESALLNVLVVVASDYKGLENTASIEESRRQILGTFRAYTTAKFGTPNNRLEKLFTFVPEVRRLGLMHYKMTLSPSMGVGSAASAASSSSPPPAAGTIVSVPVVTSTFSTYTSPSVVSATGRDVSMT